MKWLGIIGAVVGFAGAAYLVIVPLYATQGPTGIEPLRSLQQMIWGGSLMVVFSLSAWCAWRELRFWLALFGLSGTVIGVLGIMSFGAFFLPGSILLLVASLQTAPPRPPDAD